MEQASWTNRAGPTTAAAPTTTADAIPAIRRIGVADIRQALSQGVDDFLAIPTQLFFLGLIYPLVGLVAARAAWGGDLLPLLFPMIAGLSLIGPVAAIGIYELSRRRERGWVVSVGDAFSVLRSPAIGTMAALGLILAVVFVAWLYVAHAIYAATLGPVAPASIGDFARTLLDTPQGWRLILIGNAVGFLFAAGVLATTVVSFPLLLDRNTSLATAVRTSIAACRANPKAMALWGLIVAALLLLGSIPAFVGLAVVMPVLGHATWHLYRRVVV
jgi:uncharacterized membrane protein